jgi:hypothetical protein
MIHISTRREFSFTSPIGRGRIEPVMRSIDGAIRVSDYLRSQVALA